MLLSNICSHVQHGKRKYGTAYVWQHNHVTSQTCESQNGSRQEERPRSLLHVMCLSRFAVANPALFRSQFPPGAALCTPGIHEAALLCQHSLRTNIVRIRYMIP